MWYNAAWQDGICHFNECFYTDISDTNGGGTTVEVRDVTGTEANVQGLTPGALYTFYVTAENAVSSQDNDITGRTTIATATTEEGGEAARECLCKLMFVVDMLMRDGEERKKEPNNVI